MRYGDDDEEDHCRQKSGTATVNETALIGIVIVRGTALRRVTVREMTSESWAEGIVSTCDVLRLNGVQAATQILIVAESQSLGTVTIKNASETKGIGDGGTPGGHQRKKTSLRRQ